jgi:ferric-dicitrate binding protein FerR (iron transport regulator)
MLLEPVDPNESFRARRRQARRSRARRRISALALVALAAAGVTLGARFLTESDTRPLATAPAGTGGSGAVQPAAEPKPEPRPYPDEMRGVHVTMALASLKGKLNEYL